MSIIFNTEDDIEHIRNRIVDQLLIVISFLGVFIISLSILGVYLFGPRITTLMHSGLLTLAILLTIFRNHFKPVVKLALLLFFLGADILFSIYQLGYISSAKIVITILPVFISFICPMRKAVYFLVLMTVAYLTLGYLHIEGVLEAGVSAEEVISRPFSWIMDCAIIAFSSIGLMYVGKTYNQAILENSQLIKYQNSEILNREKKYEVLFQSSNDAIMLIRDMKLVDCNEKALQLFGYSRKELLGSNPLMLSPEIQPDGETSLSKAEFFGKEVAKGEPQFFEWLHSKKNGEEFTAFLSLKLVKLEGSRFVQVVIRDITHRKKIEKELLDHQDHLEQLVEERTLKLEQTNKMLSEANLELKETLDQLRQTQAQLIESEKMASVGILTGGISHEINNPLNFILGGLYKLKDTFSNPEDYDEEGELEETRVETIEIIDEGVTRIRDIVKSLNHFNRANDHIMQPCDVHVILDNCLRILNHELLGLKVQRNFQKGALNVFGNDGKLHQIFLNLIHNANQSILGKGNIEILTAISNETRMAVIKVKDNGTGIPEENLTKVFDPFFTTKPPGEGVGLGLFIVYQLVKEHEGDIQIASDDSGTQVTVVLPLG